MYLILIVLLLIAVALIVYQYQKSKHRKEEQFDIFVTLMATRAYPTEKEDVKTLATEEEFHKEQNILDTWNQYLDFLGKEQTHREANSEKRITLLVKLLSQMANMLQIDVSKQEIEKGCRTARPLENFDEVQLSIRQEMTALLQQGKK